MAWTSWYERADGRVAQGMPGARVCRCIMWMSGLRGVATLYWIQGPLLTLHALLLLLPACQ